ncbi:MAG TPA: UxaA family hydrolase [Candidatus Anaerotruncus excrementipullorum]|uniref:UxaA family hydrolase n=1 Tax=Candidatus Anaerotruncus excrementipullorum TaxID=2838465 RepID=A0A9D1WS24_9FIRM|nr:UxaA family hydrolase [Candidatus Anaerotruncus excrementipullorum]
MSEKKLAVQVQPIDNVASIFAEVQAGDQVEVAARDGSRVTLTANQDIPYGHKIALREIAKGETVTKYGESIGIATADIQRGDYVHVHNLDSARARGDWKEQK